MLSKQQNSTLNSGQASLDTNQLASLQQLTSGFSPLQLAWASGYLAAKSEQPGSSPAIAPQAQASATLTILYASQTGNAKGVASKLAEQAKSAGISVNLKNVADYKAKSLKSESHLLIVASTNGEGEPPDDALSFHEFLYSKKAPKLADLSYSVLSLGDSSYEFFCQTGKDFDEQLKKLGAKRVAERVDCDVDYQHQAQQWSKDIVESLKEELTSSQSADVVTLPVNEVASSQYSKESPYEAELLVNQKITGRDSAKDVRHIEIDLTDSGLTYQVGDALGVWFENDESLVNDLLATVKLTGEELVNVGTKEQSIKQALIETLEITQSNGKFVEFWANQSDNQVLKALVEDKSALREFALENQVIDVIKLAPASVDAQALASSLRQITPRLYSIASSQSEVDEEVHLTLGVVQFDKQGENRLGGASGFLSQRLDEGGKVKVFVEENNNFRLPQSDDTDVIMIGPGTGVAPFRAFMQEREARDAGGRNWMFFGDQTFTQDFLYQVEWQNYLKSGLLTKMDVAFSRDQAEKVYVQHRIQEHAADVYAWLEAGAHLYICGDANRMAKDVHQALIDVIVEQGKKTAEQAEDYLKTLRADKRYQRDVY
ncbi:sulfite reductase [NADPH] flavoprotein alpha-component [Thalassotalea eurytherma]|uniref:Sulfite reductase [NADPH] flavoprotein alpha-component n=2 Tax=Thalassotalea eurytherma TaxID=1144278 RepID=A0ABQ6H5I3_9GAMM|nr:assimilatory sulfite reductase (NADPH) flavoprotein subunit [Thalassotalea eurytherma]GLX83423.1 sulfite reductase [NADPH] flavoprotein alpha-component [Thalassotalea eurytherma]